MFKQWYSSPPLSVGDMLQDPQWMLKPSIEPCIKQVFSYAYIHFSASLWLIQIASVTILMLWRHY